MRCIPMLLLSNAPHDADSIQLFIRAHNGAHEIKRLLAVGSSLKTRVLLSLGYGCGLRASEIVSLGYGCGLRASEIVRLAPPSRVMTSRRRMWIGMRPSRGGYGHAI